MGLYRFKPIPSGRMGILWTLSGIREACVVEFGCMGHMLYGANALKRGGIYEGFGAGLYTTYIDETDIALGDTSRLKAVIENVIKTVAPKVIFLLPSAVPEVIGIDLFAISGLLQPEFSEVPLIPIGRGSFAITQHRGVEEALLAITKALAVDTEKTKKPTFNIIGSCPDLFRFHADANEIVRIMKGAFDMDPVSIFSSDTSVSDIEMIGSAHINLVIRKEGEKCALYLKHRYSTPYILDRPYGIKGTEDWVKCVSDMLGIQFNKEFIDSEYKRALEQIDYAFDTLEYRGWSYPEEAVINLGGHIDVVKGILNFATNEMPFSKGDCWCDCPEMGTEDIPFLSENEWVSVVSNHRRGKGYLMASGEALAWSKNNTQLQISNPDIIWRIHPYEPPFVGFRGAVHLTNLWMGEYAQTH